MPVSNDAVSVGTAITEVAGPSINPKLVYLQDGDYDNETAVYVGGSAVATTDGVKLSKTNTTVFQLNADDTLYAVGSRHTGVLMQDENPPVRVTTSMVYAKQLENEKLLIELSERLASMEQIPSRVRELELAQAKTAWIEAYVGLTAGVASLIGGLITLI